MRYHSYIILLFLLLSLVFPIKSYSYTINFNDPVSNSYQTIKNPNILQIQAPSTGNNGGGGNCSYNAFVEYVGKCESGGSYTIVNQYGYMGKYQFGWMALTDLGYMSGRDQWTGKDGINSQSDFLNSPQAQEKAMQEWLNQKNAQIERNNLDTYIGQTIGGCKVTRTGIMAGLHLLGVGNENNPGVKQYLESNGANVGQDANGTTAQTYICRFSGYQNPFDDEAGSCSGNEECTGGSPGGSKSPTHDPDGTGGYQPRPDLAQEEADALKQRWVRSLQMMAEQFTATMIWQVEAIGLLLDAKHQLETQRLFQQKTAEAHRDYQPSEQMCTFGTFTIDLAATQRNADLSKQAINQQVLQRELNSGESMGASPGSDKLSRIKRFRDKFCNPEDNGGGLKQICPTAAPADMQNADINFTTSIDQKLSLDINLSDTVTTKDEEIVFALVDNLFAHNIPLPTPKDLINKDNYRYQYMNYRSLVAMRGIAKNSMANIIALKSETPNANNSGSGPYLKALMVEFGLLDEEIEKLLGENPSYWAQMEILTKKMYQNPNFYTNLMDKPANVKRIRAAMQAVKLMQDRDIAQALQRREMLLSIMLELRLRKQADDVYSSAERAMFEQ